MLTIEQILALLVAVGLGPSVVTWLVRRWFSQMVRDRASDRKRTLTELEELREELKSEWSQSREDLRLQVTNLRLRLEVSEKAREEAMVMIATFEETVRGLREDLDECQKQIRARTV